MSSNNNDQRIAFRNALGNFATGITVITTTTADGAHVGMTANSFNSVSLDPPLVLWSIGKNATGFDDFMSASHYTINVLAADQVNLSNQFASKTADKFEGVDFEAGLSGAAKLKGCAAVFECKAHQSIEAGDHWVLIGQVENFTTSDSAPLLYHQGRYSLVAPLEN